MPTSKPTFASMSVKGGVGKSAVIANVGIRLGKWLKVGIIDCDVDSPNLPEILGLRKLMELNKVGKFKPVEYNSDVKLFSMGCFYGKRGQGMAKWGEDNRMIIQQALEETAWGNIDVFLIDLPAGSSDEMHAMLENFPNINGVILVTQPTTETDLLRCIDLTSNFLVPVIGVIENMHGAVMECHGMHPVCPSCGKAYMPLGESNISTICKEKGVKYLGAIPVIDGYSRQIREGNPILPRNQGKPITQALNAIKKVMGVK